MMSVIAVIVSLTLLPTATVAESCAAGGEIVANSETNSIIQARADVVTGVELKVHPDSDVAKTGRGEWIIYPEGSCGPDDLKSLAKNMPNNTRAVVHGHPEKGGLCFFIMEGTREGVWQKLAMHRWNGTPQVEASRALYVDVEAAQESEQLEEAGLPWGLDLIDQKSSTMDGKFESMGTHKGKGVKVYVFDTGIRTSHREFEGRAVPELEAFEGVKCESWEKHCAMRKCRGWHGHEDCAVDWHGHGTFCAGIVGGKNVGVAKKVRLHAVKVINGSVGKAASLFVVINELLQQNLESVSTVFSLSLNFKGDPSTDDLWWLKEVPQRGITLVVAAGNQRKSTGWTGNMGVSLVVGAMDRSGSLWKDNNVVRSVISIFAPGVDITSAWSGSDSAQRIKNGTSAASAHVAGAAALLLSEAKAKNLTPDDSSLGFPIKVPGGVSSTLKLKGKQMGGYQVVYDQHGKSKLVNTGPSWRRLFIGKETGLMDGWQKAVQPVQRTGTKELRKRIGEDYTASDREWHLVLR